MHLILNSNISPLYNSLGGIPGLLCKPSFYQICQPMLFCSMTFKYLFFSSIFREATFSE